MLTNFVLGFAALCAGAAVSAGTFAFLLVIGVVPRMLHTTKLTAHVMTIETVIVFGVILGCLSSLFPGWGGAAALSGTIPAAGVIGHAILLIYGLASGIFVGCIAVALAEILDTFPIMLRRFRLPYGIECMIFAMAFGKLFGALFAFFGGYKF